jgi:small subunit ribosomal protein S7
MPRGQLIRKKRILLDPRFSNPVLGKFVARMMERGKKSVTYTAVYGALDIIKAKVAGKEPVEVFQKALDNVKPVVEVKSRRVGGATLQVPVEIRDERRDALAMRWIISYSRSRHGRSMAEKLAAELIDAFNKKEDTHKMAEANKAFAHYRW